MANQRRYYVELRNSSGTTRGVHVHAYSEQDAMYLVAAANPGWRVLCSRLA